MRILILMNSNENNQNSINTDMDEIIAKKKAFIRTQCKADSLMHKQFIFLNLFKVANYYYYCIIFGSGTICRDLKVDKLLYLHGVNVFLIMCFVIPQSSSMLRHF